MIRRLVLAVAFAAGLAICVGSAPQFPIGHSTGGLTAASFGTLRMDLNPDDYVGSDNDTITEFLDSTANAFRFYSDVTWCPASPTFQTNEVNGHDVVRFVRASNQCLFYYSAGTPIVQNPSTVFSVVKWVGSAYPGYIIGYQGNNYVQTLYDAKFWRPYKGSAIDVGTNDATGWHILETVWNGTGTIAAIDGFQTFGYATTTAADNVAFWGSYDNSGAGAYHWDGDHARILVYSGVLTPAVRNSARAWLGAQYGVTVQNTDAALTCGIASGDIVLDFEGDSLLLNSGGNTGQDAPNQMIRHMNWTGSAGAYAPNRAVGASTIAIMDARSATVDGDYDAGKDSWLFIEVGGNDLNTGRTGVQVHADLTAYVDARQAVGWKVAVMTIPAMAIFDAAEETQRGIANGLIAGDSAGADLLVDIAADSRLQATTDRRYYQADGTHWAAGGSYVVGRLAAQALCGL